MLTLAVKMSELAHWLSRNRDYIPPRGIGSAIHIAQMLREGQLTDPIWSAIPEDPKSGRILIVATALENIVQGKKVYCASKKEAVKFLNETALLLPIAARKGGRIAS